MRSSDRVRRNSRPKGLVTPNEWRGNKHQEQTKEMPTKALINGRQAQWEIEAAAAAAAAEGLRGKGSVECPERGPAGLLRHPYPIVTTEALEQPVLVPRT